MLLVIVKNKNFRVGELTVARHVFSGALNLCT